MIGKASDSKLKQGLEAHRRETEGQIARLEQVFRMHGVEAKGVDRPAIDGILKEAGEIAGEVDDEEVLDAALVAAARAVEHYEITRYGTLKRWATVLGLEDAARLLAETLAEESKTDEDLTGIADAAVNAEAMHPAA